MSSSILENPDESEVGESPMASSTPITSPSSSSGNQAQDLERSEVVTFDSRKSVKRLDKLATVSRFRQTFEK